MSALDEARSRLLALHERVAETGPAWLAPLRRSGAETFAAEGLPHTKLEEWRYTNLAGLAKLRFDLPEPDRTAVSRTDPQTNQPTNTPTVGVVGWAGGQVTDWVHFFPQQGSL